MAAHFIVWWSEIASGYINLTIIRGKETEKTDIKEALERFLSCL